MKKTMLKTVILTLMVTVFLFSIATAAFAKESGQDPGDTGYLTDFKSSSLSILYSVEVSNWHMGNFGFGLLRHRNINVWTLAGYVHVLNVHMWKSGNCYKFYESKSGKDYSYCGQNPADGLKSYFSQLANMADEISKYLGLAIVASAVAAVITWAIGIIINYGWIGLLFA